MTIEIPRDPDTYCAIRLLEGLQFRVFGEIGLSRLIGKITRAMEHLAETGDNGVEVFEGKIQ